MERQINKILIANRGVSAVRIMHTCRDRRISAAAIYSTPDRLAEHVLMADVAVHIGEAPPKDSYLDMDRIIAAAHSTGADAVHPGYGFLAENDQFARKVIDSGLTWIGPPPDVMAAMGNKIEAKRLAQKFNVPVIPGISDVSSADDIHKWIDEQSITFPIVIKAAAGGGGKGMVKVDRREDIGRAFEQARSESKKAFGCDEILVEKFIERGRHIEVQVVADNHGNVVHLYERECTIQRRNQKLIEEAPSPSLTPMLRTEICETAAHLMRSINYRSVGTVEFMFDSATNRYYFLEVNTRLQVEHGITELVTGLDVVGIMIDIAAGQSLPFRQRDVVSNRWALEVRLNAEDPRTLSPSFGRITRLELPFSHYTRVTSGVYEGAHIPPYYDSLLMLLMTTGPTRRSAIKVMDRVLSRNLRVEGVKTTQSLLLSILRHPSFISGEFTTSFVEENFDKLIATFKDTEGEDEVLKIARYVATISALGPQEWM
ncbi:MAG: biotin carboxylase N-terminal domain-containing protein [Pseudomonadota bacterium]